jgi:hypothetical protein
MAHFVKLSDSNVVEDVIVIDNSVLDDGSGSDNEQLGKDYIANDLKLSGNWIQTSYNNNFRGMYAEIGGTYNETFDKFVPANGMLDSEGNYQEKT